MATLLVHIKIHPGKEAAFERVAHAMYEATHGTESGVRRYEYWRGEAEGTYYCLQSFDDANCFIRHQVSPHHEGFGPDFAELIQSIRLEWVDALADASPLVPSRHQDLPADATDAMRNYAKRQGLQVQAWWERLRQG
jgi:quinol monooxygenase YgiN